VPRVLNVLFKWKWLIVLCAFAVAVPVAVIVFLKAPQYQVSMKVLVKSARAELAMSLSGPAERIVNWPVTVQILNSAIQILKSQDLLETAVKESNFPLLAPDVESTPVTRERAMMQLRNRLSFTPVPDSNVIEIGIQDPDPAAAARLLNTLAALYLKRHADLHAGGEHTTTFFDQQVKFHRERFDRAQAELEQFQQRDNIISIKDEMDLNLNKLTAMEGSLKELNAEISAVAKEVTALEAQISDQPQEITKERVIMVNPEITSMRTKMVDLERQRDELLQRYTPKSRFVADKEAEIATLRKALEAREPNIHGDTVVAQNRLRDALSQIHLQKRAALAAAEARRDVLRREKSSYESRLSVLKDRTFDLARLRGDFDLARDTYFMYEKKAEEARVSRAMDEQNLTSSSVVQAASAPILPLPRGLTIAAGVSGIAGLVLGVTVAFLLEFCNLTVKDEKDVERFLQLPVLATVRHF
jgi:uncharacterized protein involved in exopolysaccharide biosynthesis